MGNTASRYAGPRSSLLEHVILLSPWGELPASPTESECVVGPGTSYSPGPALVQHPAVLIPFLVRLVLLVLLFHYVLYHRIIL